MEPLSVLIHVPAFVSGMIVAAWTLLSAIKTFVLPRSAQDSITRGVFFVTQYLFDLRTRKVTTYAERDRIMAIYAPISLIILLAVWLALILLSFTLMIWASGIRPLSLAFKLSGSSLFTLGFATSDSLLVTLLDFFEALIGLILIALLIGYLPTMYNAFSQRELAVTLLEVRAGSPPSAIELIKRFHRLKSLDRLGELWTTWEAWFASVEESHTSLTPLNFFRSPQPQHSWVTAAGAVLDGATLMVAAVDVPHDIQADLCIRAGYLALRRIGDFFSIAYHPDPLPTDLISISRYEFDEACDELAAAGVPLKADREQAWRDFSGWRVNYDSVLLGLAQITMAPYAPWSSDRSFSLQWQDLMRKRAEALAAQELVEQVVE